MKIDRRKVKRILFITLSNIGDIILTTPIITVLEREFPEARVDIMVGPSGKGIFTDHPSIFKVIVYNKHMKLQSKKRLIQKLQKIKYDLIVDLRNSLFPMLIGARYKTSPICSAPKNIVHKKDSHLWKLKNLGIDVGDESFSLHITDEDRNYVDKLLKGVANRERIVIVSPTAKSLIKRWKPGSFAELSDRIAGEMNASVIMSHRITVRN